MAFLFATPFYLVAILFYSISHCLPIERAQGLVTDWSYGSHGFDGFKAAAPNFGRICNGFQLARSQKLICFLCNGFDPSCFAPSTTPPPTTPSPTTTTTSSTTTLSTSTTAATSIVTATAEAEE